ncbi:sigma-70 family RNA polymerase sigma factor [Thermosynechococcus vestitus]|uniref:Tll1980 protein n=1 Tax=Thermosynechococcus vestitus (strain NIES-2133 / IAM M-273 / BP-1) TaxID=197221 RepID=Q8DHH9_THEVB|nr:sigma-70 family RNA polymerase sigma factor [Thermosynechococcus vestitus]BAC09532.1 tll1980 [Thermosynechococcus vestitus BP-1]
MTRQRCDKLIALLQFDDSDRPRWSCDRQLQGYFTAAGYNLEEPDWTANLLLQQLQSQPNHPDADYWRRGLFCYLQETNWFVAIALREKVRGHQVTDCFQQACCLSNDPLRLLQGFDPQRGTRLSTYAYRRIYDQVYAALVGVRQSDWGLLRDTGRRRLSSALKNQGYSEDKIVHIQQLVHLWQELADQPTAPDQALLEQVVKIYHQCRPDLPCVTSREVGTLLRTAISALRAHGQPQVVNTAEERFWDILEGRENMPWEAILKQEEQETLKRVFEILKNAVETLDDASRQVFCLYYCEQLSQQQIAQDLGFEKQYKVSRALERIRSHLAKAVLAALDQPTHPQRLRELTLAINLWLNEGYQVLAAGCQRCSPVARA